MRGVLGGDKVFGAPGGYQQLQHLFYISDAGDLKGVGVGEGLWS